MFNLVHKMEAIQQGDNLYPNLRLGHVDIEYILTLFLLK